MKWSQTEADMCRAIWDKLCEGPASGDSRDRNYALSLEHIGATVNRSDLFVDWPVTIKDRGKWNKSLAIFRMTKEITVIRKYT